MSNRPPILILLLMSALVVTGLLTGCSEDTTAPAVTQTAGDDYSQFDFSLPYGGLTASDEDVAFGDAALLAMSVAEEDEEIDDPVADDPVVRDLERRGRHRYDPEDPQRPQFTFVHLRWGMLRDMMDSVAVTPPCAVTDWTGAIHVDRGILLVRRVIRFEQPADHIILPRLDPQTVGLVSHTACGFDGVVLQIIEGPQANSDGDIPDPEPNLLHIDLGGFGAEIAVAELAGLDRVVTVDDLGNEFAVTGFTLDDIAVCPKGFVSGHFRRLAEGRPDSGSVADRAGERYGVFAGMWRTLDGRIGGHLRGGYGVDADGQRVFVGKYIGPRGGFRGLIRGTWEPGDAAATMATFQGHWSGAGGQVEGLLGGEAFAVEGTPGGFFAGRWTTLCDEQAEEEVR